MKSKEIRKKFFDFFLKHGHTQVPSSSLVPAEDPTLLFTNAGMNQFKDVFLGKETRSYTRAVSIQKCMRAGGKHNDLDNVGFTNRHLTLFEMMGNFSFGDYFKKEAIEFAWDFLTNHMHFDPEKMYATVYKDDDESFDLWHKVVGLPTERIYRLGEADNFWQMGDTGPCGPCTEIMVDRGVRFGCGSETCAPGCDCDRYLEVWNLVFMQYDRQPDGTDVPLKQKGVDTGMGLERLCLIVQEKNSVFETDLFAGVIKKIEELTNIYYERSNADIKAAFNVIADHVRAASFLIADGITPSNEGRGYVLRKVIRRGALFAQKLTNKNIFPDLADVIIEEMGSIYPELIRKKEAIKRLLTLEIEKFAANLVQGQNILNKFFEQATEQKIIDGKQTFKLYDTYGFPVELTKVIAQEKGFTVDTEGFEKNMEKQRELSGKKAFKAILPDIELPANITTEFTGYQEITTPSTVSALITDAALVDKISAGTEGWLVAEKLPFYVEKGGQVSDEGVIEIQEKSAKVEDLKRVGDAIAAKIIAPVDIKVGDSITAKVDKEFRYNVMYNHTATHLLQAALIKILGDEVRQSGSLVHPDYLRFDFTFHRALTPEEIVHVEALVNEKIRENIPVDIFNTTYEKAMKHGVMAIFGEKYNPEEVRVIDIPSFSAELCGGTHCPSTGIIGAFKITQEGALSAGQRRIFAVTGPEAIKLFQQSFDTVKQLSQDFKVQPHEIIEAIEKQRTDLKKTQSALKQLKKQTWQQLIPAWLEKTEMVNAAPFLFLDLKNYAVDELREIGQALLAKKPGVYFLYSTIDDRSMFICMTADEYASSIDFKKFGAWLKDTVGLRGGGKKTTLQGGGPRLNPEELHKKLLEYLTSN